MTELVLIVVTFLTELVLFYCAATFLTKLALTILTFLTELVKVGDRVLAINGVYLTPSTMGQVIAMVKGMTCQDVLTVKLVRSKVADDAVRALNLFHQVLKCADISD